MCYNFGENAGMMELVDMRDLGSRAVMRWGSSPHARTRPPQENLRRLNFYRCRRSYPFIGHLQKSRPKAAFSVDSHCLLFRSPHDSAFMALARKLSNRSASRSTLVSMSFSIRFQKNCITNPM